MTADELDAMAGFIAAIETAEKEYQLFLSGRPLVVDSDGKGHGVLHAAGNSEHTWGES